MPKLENALLTSDIIERFGGVRALSRLLGHPHHTMVSEWRRKGSIPGEWLLPLYEIARLKRIRLSLSELVHAAAKDKSRRSRTRSASTDAKAA